MPERALTITDPGDREDLTQFVGRAVRLDPAAVVRLRARPDGRVGAWASTGFEVIAARSVPGELSPPDTTVNAADLLSALAVERGVSIDPGFAVDAAWRSALPPERGLTHVEDVPAHVLTRLCEQGVALAKEHSGPHGPPASLLDSVVLTAHGGGLDVAVPLRCLFALSGMGFVGEADGEPVRVRANGGWLRLDARYGAVLWRRHPQLPLLV